MEAASSLYHCHLHGDSISVCCEDIVDALMGTFGLVEVVCDSNKLGTREVICIRLALCISPRSSA